MLKTIVIFHRVLRDGSQPLMSKLIDGKATQAITAERSLPPHWTDADILQKYTKYLGIRLSSNYIAAQVPAAFATVTESPSHSVTPPCRMAASPVVMLLWVVSVVWNSRNYFWKCPSSRCPQLPSGGR